MKIRKNNHNIFAAHHRIKNLIKLYRFQSNRSKLKTEENFTDLLICIIVINNQSINSLLKSIN